MPNLSPWPHYDSSQIRAASSVLESGLVNSWTGSQTALFESEFSAWNQSRYAVASANGTLALNSAYSSIGLSRGCELITTPRTFIATASSAVMLGATPIFADVDLDSGCITADTIEPLITSRTSAVSLVHLAGWPADVLSISALCKAYGIALVEDCAQAHGASVHGKPVGSFGDVSAWSFCQDKIMTTGGEGGMITTSREDIWEHVWSLKDHGKSYEKSKAPVSSPGFRWLHDSFGSNYRLTEFQSAIGRIQLRHLPSWTASRTSNAMLLVSALSDFPSIRVPLPPSEHRHAWYKFYAYVDQSSFTSGWSRDRVIAEINSRGYPAYSGSCSEIYLEKCFQTRGLTPASRLPNAKQLGETSLMFLVHPTITTEQMSAYSDCILSVLRLALR